MTITAASFPTPDVVKTTNNPAIWDQQARFATLQAAGANEALQQLSSRLDRVSSELERQMVFIQTYRDLAEWRFRLAGRAEGRRPGALPEQYRAPIGIGRVRDAFGRGDDQGSAQPRGSAVGQGDGPEPGSPASRLGLRLGELAEARFEAEAPDRDVLQNQVRLPSGETIDGNRLLRGTALAEELGRDQPVDGLYCAVTGELQDRRALQREAFATFAELETARASGRTDLLDDVDARRAFVDAEYFLYQGPEYQRGSDATIRSLVAVAHTRIFGAAPQLPQDIDLMAYVAGQEAFHSHVNRTQAVLSPTTGSSPRPGLSQQPSARRHHRSAGQERG
ncbi:hypothetical protein AB0F43_28460 [Kribbella sp. NPDC023972]|uniref:hypothetical protein n=1 Tax=Kribbella sp. NPDC023972 TaxID=3154795 RepID=UPI00340FAB82